MALGEAIETIHKTRAFAYSTILECLDKGKAMNPDIWIPEKRKAKNLAVLFGNDEVRLIVLDIVDNSSRPLTEFQNEIDERLLPAMKRDISRPWWRFW